MKYLRKTKSGLVTLHEDTREYERTPKDSGCCSLHWMPAGELCDNYVMDDGPGILMSCCTRCWYYNDRRRKSCGNLVEIKIFLNKVVFL